MRNSSVFFAVVASALMPFSGASAAGQTPVKVMLLGDSLSVGGFGDGMQDSLIRKYGEQNVAIFASCGSSPEDWLSGDFVTNCGYRQTTPAGRVLCEYHNGVRPRPVRTPKLRTLLGHYRPEIVIIQQGTNWMDALAAAGQPDAARYCRIIEEFIGELRRGNPSAVIFWVLPPSSSKYPPRVHDQVDRWINGASRKMAFYTINSRRMTGSYRDGRTGGDGVHYSDGPGQAWARAAYRKIADGLRALALAPAPTGP